MSMPVEPLQGSETMRTYASNFFKVGPAVLAILIVPTGLSAQASADSKTLVHAEFFVGTCFNSIDDVSRVSSMAETLDWEPMPEDIANSLKPVEGEGYEGWIVQHLDNVYLVGINTGEFKGRDTNICSVVMDTTKEQFLSDTKDIFELSFLFTDKEPFQRIDFYSTDNFRVSESIIQILYSADGKPPINVSIMGIK